MAPFIEPNLQVALPKSGHKRAGEAQAQSETHGPDELSAGPWVLKRARRGAHLGCLFAGARLAMSTSTPRMITSSLQNTLPFGDSPKSVS